jgi:nucleolar pre-ribosomal-associated protein 1
LYAPEEEDVEPQAQILYEYLDTQKTHHNLGRSAYLHELIQILHFASTQNDDSLFSSVTAVLALLFKPVSSRYLLLEHGGLISEVVLADAQVQLVSKGLNAPKHKEHVISPCLRLLTEIASVDGGAFGRQLYAQRDHTFDPRTIARNLSLSRAAPKADDGKSRPSIRTNTIRYLLANLRLQNVAVQTDILKQGPVVKALIEGLSNDPPPLIYDVVTVLDAHVAGNENMHRSTKSLVFSARHLSLLYALHRGDPPDEGDFKGRKLQDAVDRLITKLCTAPECGVLKPGTGWYPVVVSEGIQAQLQNSPYSALAEFANFLQPLSDQGEQELLLAIFKAAPELVADYWQRSTNFSFEPKLSSTWIGYASLVFSSIDLPVPEYFGSKDGYSPEPPNSHVAIESIVPMPLNSKVLTKCLHNSSPLVNFFALRILTIALQKLKRVLSMYHVANGNQPADAWSEGKEALISLATRRLPGLNEVIKAFRKTPSGNRLQFEVATRLITLYYELLTHVAFQEKLDISTVMAETLQKVQQLQEGDQNAQLQLLELTHLIRIAQNSSAISWWKRQSLELTPFLTVLLVYARSGTNLLKEIEGLLESITREYGILQHRTKDSAVMALSRSLMTGTGTVSQGVLAFIDDCFQRFVKRPIAYEDEFDQLVSSHNMSPADLKPISLFIFTVSEQWSFVETHRREFSQDIATWISTLFASLCSIGEDFRVLDALRARMVSQDERRELSIDLGNQISRLALGTSGETADSEMTNGTTTLAAAKAEPSFDISIFRPPNGCAPPNFLKFRSGNPAMLLGSDDLNTLILCLSSEDAVTRSQALTAVQHFTVSIQASAYTDKEMMYLLLGELAETCKLDSDLAPWSLGLDSTIAQHRQPFIITSFAVHAIRVVGDPTHALYSKLCSYLTRYPSWKATGLVRHFLDSIITQGPTEDSETAPWRELLWLLDWIFDGLRTSADGEILRKAGIWEALGAVGMHPALGGSMARGTVDGPAGGRMQHKVRGLIVNILGRALCVGQAATVGTRAGGLAWMDIWESMGWIEKSVALSFKRAIASEKKVRGWSFGAVDAV